MDDARKRQVLDEMLLSRLQVIEDYVSEIPEMKQQIDRMDKRLERVESDVSVIKMVVRRHSEDIAELRKLAS